MTFAEDLALAGAARIRRSAGPRAGLIAYRALARRLDDGRGPATLAALALALEIDDQAAFDELVDLWGTAPGDGLREIAALVRTLDAKGDRASLVRLLRAECRRLPRALTAYFFGRAAESTGPEGDHAESDRAYEEAVAMATRTGDARLALLARASLSLSLARRSEHRARAVLLARGLDPARIPELPPDLRIGVARLLLDAPSRFTRATGLGILDEVAKAEGPYREMAMAVAADFTDSAGHRASPLERDRLLAILSRDPDEARRAAVAKLVARAFTWSEIDAASPARAAEQILLAEPGRLEEVLRAREVLENRAPSRRSGGDPGVEVVAALRAGRIADAAVALDHMQSARSLPNLVHRTAWAAVLEALGNDATRVAAEGLFRLLVARGAAPRHGFLAYAARLRGETRIVALRQAQRSGEPGAKERLERALVATALETYRQGNREATLARLREAKTLAMPGGE